MRCKDKKVLITGASAGIGRACAHYFAREGADLLLCARRKEKLEQLSKELRDYPIQIELLPLDLRDKRAVLSAFTALPKQWQAIDILINNAGLALGFDKIVEGEINDWETMIDTNIKSVLYVTKLVLKGMLEKNSGHIINLGSIASYQVYSGGIVYCATKFALRAISEGLKLECHGTPIRVTLMGPGMVHTDFSMVRFKGDKTRADKVYAGMKPLTAEDIADAILYCATRPPHVDVCEMIILPTAQSAATLYHRESE